MKFWSQLGVVALLGALGSGAMAPFVCATEPSVPGAAGGAPDTGDDHSHDFDFNFGVWKTHIRYFTDPLSGSKEFVEMNGTVAVRKVWGGRAQLEEVEADGPHGHWEGLTLFMYNPAAHQWSMNFANSRNGTITPPAIGAFSGGRGEFYDQESVDGRSTLVRIVWSDITPDAHHFEQALSRDGGRTWAPNFVATVTRAPPNERPQAVAPPAANAGQHDFDWQFGTWKIQMSRLEHPLTGSTTWTELDGKVVVQEVWGGRANLAEIGADGASGHLEFLSLRLFNPQSRQWSLYFASSNTGTLGAPEIGEFSNGRGEFYVQRLVDGRTILVRFAFADMGAGSSRDEQAYSQDGGRTWEANWINHQTRELQ
jgi:hypothetical protein